MHLIARFIIFSASVKICLTGIIVETPKRDQSGLIEAAVNILTSCYVDRLNTVGLAGVSIGTVGKTFALRGFPTPVVFIENTSRIMKNDTINSISRCKIQFFVITATNSSNLSKTLIEIKNSIWWNHMALFLLLDLPVSKHGCSDVYEMLWEAWTMNLLDTKLMCLHPTRGKLIYTYNPYTSKAPYPWQVQNTYKGSDNHIWTLFMQVYRDNWHRSATTFLDYEKFCDALNFDKTIDLGGYEIRASVRGMETWWYADPSMKPTIIGRVNNISVQTVISSLNATWKFLLHPASDLLPVSVKGKPTILDETDFGISDIGFNYLHQDMSRIYASTYPHFVTSLSLITQYPGHMSQLSKIISVLDCASRFCLLLVCLITLLFFTHYLRKHPIIAILNLILMICNASLSKIPKKLAPRIYLGSFFLFALTIQGIYQGKLASLLTKNEPLPNVNTIEDLARSNYTVYGYRMFHSFLNESSFEGHFVELNKFSCTDYVLNNSKAACLAETLRLIHDAAKFNLHLSSEAAGYFYTVYLIRPDWPLEKRINTILRKCFEGNLIQSIFAAELHSIIYSLRSYETEDQDQKFKVLILENLNFAFIILGFGLGCATIRFIVEIGISRAE